IIKELQISLNNLEKNFKITRIYKQKKRDWITRQLATLQIEKSKIPKSTLFEYIGRVSNLLKIIQSDVTKNHGRNRGKDALETVYCYIASSFKVTVGEKKVFRKVYRDMQIMGYDDGKDANSLPKPIEETLIGTIAGDDDYLFDSRYGASKTVFSLLISLLDNSTSKEYSFSETIPKLGLEYFHEVYYDPFVELDIDYSEVGLYLPQHDSKFNQIPIYSDETGKEFYFVEITKPSFVLRHKPYLAMFDYEKEGSDDIKMEPTGGIHVYEISLKSILNISTDVKMSNMKSAIYFGKIFNYIKPIETEALDTILFGSNILKIENTGWISQTDKLAESKIFKMLERAVVGSDGYTGEATITCVYSPIRVGSIVRIPFIMNKITKYAYGYIATVKDSFSASGEALTTLDLHFIDLATMFMFMGFLQENTEGNAPTLGTGKSSSSVSKSKTFVNNASA
ncbi:MAG: hypothetical protein EBS19_12945, partial [Spirochaetia bacterium]|nr:hypothetical protein [Spirochaetia bacterium]